MGPKKPHRSSSTSESAANYFSAASNPNMFLETSFTSLQSPSSNSSITNGYFSTKSQPSPISVHQPMSSFNLSIRSNRSDMSFKSQQLPLTKVGISNNIYTQCFSIMNSLVVYFNIIVLNGRWFKEEFGHWSFFFAKSFCVDVERGVSLQRNRIDLAENILMNAVKKNMNATSGTEIFKEKWSSSTSEFEYGALMVWADFALSITGSWRRRF